MVQASNGLTGLDLYDDFEDNLLTGRTAPYQNITHMGTAGTLAISAVTPISGTYSLTHLGNGASGSGNSWGYSITGAAGPYNYQYSADFDIKLISKGANAAEPTGYMWFFEFTDTNNYTAAYTDLSGGNQRIRLLQKVAGATSTIATTTWLTGAAWAVGAAYHVYVRVLDTGYTMYIGSTQIFSVTQAYLGATTYHGGGGGDRDTKLMWDNIYIRTETAASYYLGIEPVIGAVGAELKVGDQIDPSDGATDDSALLTFNSYASFPVVLDIESWDGSVRETKPFYWVSTNTFNLGYEGLDQYMALRLRVLTEATKEAVVNIKNITFKSE